MSPAPFGYWLNFGAGDANTYPGQPEPENNPVMRCTVLALCFLCGGFVSAQTYLATYQADVKTISGGPVSGKTSLYFTIDSAVYIHDEYPTESSYSQNGTLVTYVLGDQEGMPILTLRSESIQRYKEEYSAAQKMFIFEEPIPQIDWKIEPETVKGDGISLRKATGWYGNRHYEVLFSPDIPFPYGPHRLGGLPGLIIKAKSDDELVSFSLKGFAKLDDGERPENIFALGEGLPVNEQEFKDYIINKLLQVEAMTTDVLTFTNEDPAADYTIEKSRWTIISEYKAKRGY